jgi:transposase-like protein
MKTKKYLSDDPIYRNKKHKWNHLIKKLRFIIDLGGVCKHCNKDLIDAPYDADFHHLDPTFKEGSPSHIIKKAYKDAKLEIEKCILLCSACHRKEHMEWKEWKNYKEELIERANKIHLKKPNQKSNDELIKHEDKIRSLYLSGMSMHQISANEGIPLSTVSYTIRKLKIKREKSGCEQKISKEEALKCQQLGMGLKEIAEKYKCDVSTVFRKLERYKFDK